MVGKQADDNELGRSTAKALDGQRPKRASGIGFPPINLMSTPYMLCYLCENRQVLENRSLQEIGTNCYAMGDLAAFRRDPSMMGVLLNRAAGQEGCLPQHSAVGSRGWKSS